MRSLFKSRKKESERATDESQPSAPAGPSLPVTENVDQNQAGMASQQGDTSASAPNTKDSVMNSPKAKAILNAFKSALDSLGKAPVPGIGVVTTALLRVINGLLEMSQVDTGWEQLADRVEYLSYLVNLIGQSPKTQSFVERLCTKLTEVMDDLAADLAKASKQGKLPAFFNSTDDLSSITAYEKRLDSIVGDLTLSISFATSQSEEQLRDDFRAEISRIDDEISKKGNLDDHSFRLVNSPISDIGGDFAANNRGKVFLSFTDSKISGVRGGAFSGNG